MKNPLPPPPEDLASIGHFRLLRRISTFSYLLVWTPHYSFLSLQPNSKVGEHTK
jgi:hypothetical protein